MAQVRFKSLRTKFLVLLALGGSLVAATGLWITYMTTVSHFESQLIKQSKLLAASLNHSAMVADTSMQVQHVVDELSRSPEINYIVVATLEPAEIMVSSNRAWSGTRLDQLPDRHLGEHLLEFVAQGEFGHHFDNEANTLVLTVPLDPQMTMMPEHDMAQGGAMMPEQDMAQGDGTMPEHVMARENATGRVR